MKPDYKSELKKWAAQRRRIVALREKGWTMDKIAAKFDMTRQRVAQILQKEAK